MWVWFFREKDFTKEFDYFLRGKESLRMDVRVPDIDGLTKEQVCYVVKNCSDIPALVLHMLMEVMPISRQMKAAF